MILFIDKLATKSKNQIYILSVNPGNLSDFIDKRKIPESNFYLYDLHYPKFLAKFETLYYKGVFAQLTKIIRNRPPNYTTDYSGWVVKNNPKAIDIKEVADRLKKNLLKREYSKERERHLVNLIEKLNQHGIVCLVRMPIDQEILKAENRFISDFDVKMEKIAEKQNIIYLNYSNNMAYSTYDGSHLYSNSAIRFTRMLGGGDKR